jgi:hypothetical protein
VKQEICKFTEIFRKFVNLLVHEIYCNIYNANSISQANVDVNNNNKNNNSTSNNNNMMMMRRRGRRKRRRRRTMTTTLKLLLTDEDAEYGRRLSCDKT